MKFIKYLLLVFIVQCKLSESYSQEMKVVRDFRAIGEVEVIKSVYKKWEISLGTKLLLEHNASRFGEFDLDAGISYKLLKFVSLGIGYRWSENRNKFNDFIIKNRLRGDIDLIAKIKRLKADYRISYQNIDDDYFQNNETATSKNILRNRLQLKYNIRKSQIFPFFYVEHYGQLGEKGKYGIKLKSAIGTGYSINKKHEIKTYFRVDRELNKKNPYLYYSVGVGYSYIF
jgi:hypothetical protein